MADATAADLPHVLRPLAEKELVPAGIIMEAVAEFTLTGAMVSVKTEKRSLAPRRLSHFAPDMLTRLAHELGPAGLVEIEISEHRLQTRGFAFFLDAATVDEIVPPEPEKEQPAEPDYPEGELGQAMKACMPIVEMMMAPMLLEMQGLREAVKISMEVQSEQQRKAMVISDLLAETQVARAKRMLLAETQTPEEAIEGHLGAVNKLMETAVKAEKQMAKYAPKADPDAEGLDKLAAYAENPSVRAIGRGFLKMLGGNVAAPVDTAPVTDAAREAGKLPNLFSVVEPDIA